jgi:hypothetical protein
LTQQLLSQLPFTPLSAMLLEQLPFEEEKSRAAAVVTKPVEPVDHTLSHAVELVWHAAHQMGREGVPFADFLAQITENQAVKRRRVYDVLNVLETLGLVDRRDGYIRFSDAFFTLSITK